MKSTLIKVALVLVLLGMGNQAFAQSETDKIYLGIGIGFDYGGIGGKIEYLPEEHIGLFGGVGYDLLSAGWNVGVTYKILPEKNVSPNLMVLYGYNGVFKGADNYTAHYNMTSYGWTVGVNVDVLTGISGNKLSVGLFLPFRSGKFMDNYDAVKDDPNVELKNELIPVGFSLGYNIGL